MIAIRQATELDVAAIHRLGHSIPEFSVNNDTVNFWPKGIIQNSIRSREAVVLVAEENTEIRGFIIANCNKAFKKVVIENICVVPNSRHTGIGKLLLSRLLSLVEKDGYEYMSTLVPTDAYEASKLYVNSGFTKGEIFQWLDKPLSSNFKSK